MRVCARRRPCTRTLRSRPPLADTNEVVARRIRRGLAAFALSGAITAAVATPPLALAPGAPDPPKGDFDARAGDRAAVPEATSDARAALTKRLGPPAAPSADPVTRRRRLVGRAHRRPH